MNVHEKKGGHILACFWNINLRSIFSVLCSSTVLNGSPHTTRMKRCLSQIGVPVMFNVFN